MRDNLYAMHGRLLPHPRGQLRGTLGHVGQLQRAVWRRHQVADLPRHEAVGGLGGGMPAVLPAGVVDVVPHVLVRATATAVYD